MTPFNGKAEADYGESGKNANKNGKDQEEPFFLNYRTKNGLGARLERSCEGGKIFFHRSIIADLAQASFCTFNFSALCKQPFDPALFTQVLFF